METMTIRLPARLLTAGQCVARSGWVHPRRLLDSSVLIVTERGRFSLKVGGARFTLGSRQALILPAGVPHGGERTIEDDPPVYYWAHFVDGPESAPHRLTLSADAQDLCEGMHNRLAVLFHELIAEKHGGDALIGDYRLSLLLLELARPQAEDPQAALYSRLSETIRLRCREPLTLSMLSDLFGYSEDYLSRLLHANARCSFREFLHRQRLVQARKALLSTTDTIQQIAAACGYSNAKFFSTVFLKYEGVTPSTYRNLYGALHQNRE